MVHEPWYLPVVLAWVRFNLNYGYLTKELTMDKELLTACSHGLGALSIPREYYSLFGVGLVVLIIIIIGMIDAGKDDWYGVIFYVVLPVGFVAMLFWVLFELTKSEGFAALGIALLAMIIIPVTAGVGVMLWRNKKD